MLPLDGTRGFGEGWTTVLGPTFAIDPRLDENINLKASLREGGDGWTTVLGPTFATAPRQVGSEQPSKYILFFDGKVNLSFVFTPRLARNLPRVILLLRNASSRISEGKRCN